MKSKQEKKLNKQLASTEAELKEKLLNVLPSATETGADLFSNSQFNPHKLNPAHLLPEAEKFLTLAKESISLRNQLGLQVKGSVGDLYLNACAELADLKNQHRRGPRRLASWMLEEIKCITSH